MSTLSDLSGTNIIPFDIAVGLGIQPNLTRVTALGHNPNIASGGAADVWEGGGNYPFLASASVLEVLSASANDTAAGTGCRTVLISGLDLNYNPISETVVMNGVTPVATINSYLRINVFTQLTVGSLEVNAGDITLRVVSAGAIVSLMRAGFGFGRQAVYTVPANNTFFIISAMFSVLAASGANVNVVNFGLMQRASNGSRRIPITFQVSSTTPYRHDLRLGLVLGPKTDFAVRVTSTGQVSTNVTAAVEGILYRTPMLGQ